jgi:DNA-binding helix-hairpin-helix protein with protein kinase domain
MTRFEVRDDRRTLLVDPNPLGAGGQGEVFRAHLGDETFALKLYYPQTGTQELRQGVERLVERGAPSEAFLWPLRIVEERESGRFGYLMPLREPRFASTEDIMARRVTPTFDALLRAAIGLVDAFLALHARGFCYRDISFGNLFVDPKTGDVRICDNDNVGLANTKAAVIGTPRFMAPEIVRREAQPSEDTDRYSLSVLLFYLLMGGHPLDGQREANIRCLDRFALDRLYGEAPVYIFDPADASNRPVPGLHDNPLAFHPLYPKRLRATFDRAFTEGLGAPKKRVRESEWRKVLTATLDAFGRCPTCRAPGFFDPEVGAGDCWRCRRARPEPQRLTLPEGAVVVQPGTTLTPRHTDAQPNILEPQTGLVVERPDQPGVLGLRNLTNRTWTVQRPDGRLDEVGPGKHAPLLPGNRINFGPAEAVVR